MAKNKKIINATEVTVDKIDFKSKFEGRVYKKLKSIGIKASYEPVPATLFEGFRPTKPWFYNGKPQVIKSGATAKIQDWQYTPDFVIRMNGYTFYVEAKGQPNDLWTYKRKMFLKWLDSKPKSYFFEVRSIRGLVASVEQMKILSQQ